MTARELNNLYRSTFATERGQMVLMDILNDCGFFSLEDVTNPQDIARLNVARRILGKMGSWEAVHVAEITRAHVETRNPRDMIKRLLGLPVMRDKGDE